MAGLVAARDESKGEQFLHFVQDPFQTTLSSNSLIASIGTSFGLTAFIFLLWCFVRPRHSVVYAPKLRHADEKHAPPKIDGGFLSWLKPLMAMKENDLVDKIGMDATIFLRFVRMCRNIFLILSIIGLGIMIPVNVGCSLKNSYSGMSKNALVLMSPQQAWGQCLWAHVVVAWTFDIIICYFLWRNYKAVLNLRKNYFSSSEYQDTLHARTLMVHNIPKELQSDEGLNQIIDQAQASVHADEKCAIARNVKDLPELVQKYEETVKALEGTLAKYFNKDPTGTDTTQRPKMKPFKGDKINRGRGKIDAIDDLMERRALLEDQLQHVRRTVNSRDTLPYGFASYGNIEQAHAVAKAAHGKTIKGAQVFLASRPNDLIWNNLSILNNKRKRNKIIGNLYFVLLCFVWIVPNALISTFLANIGRIGQLWDGFQGELNRNPKFWALVQGFAAPLLTTLIFLVLPMIMRKISAWQGDLTRTSRERHVTHKLYIFFVFNNLIVFTLFGTVWNFVATVVASSGSGKNAWEAIKDQQFATKLVTAVINVSTFWIMYLLQRNLGAVLDLAQLVTFVWKSAYIRFSSPTPRERIEWSACHAFDYASYYNYFLFYSTIALVFSTLQPIVLLVAAFYFTLDSFWKKYLLMYMFITKIESGGAFWRVLFNRFVFATGFANIIQAGVVWVLYSGPVACVILPLPFLLVGFKFYCKRAFDDQIHFYTTGKISDTEEAFGMGKPRKNDHLRSRYGHPALYRRLMKPMVDIKHRPGMARAFPELTGSAGPATQYSYGDIPMENIRPGAQQEAEQQRPTLDSLFEFVDSTDFSHFKNRPEFADFGGAGQIFGRAEDALSLKSRSTTLDWNDTPVSTRPSTPAQAFSSGHRQPDYQHVFDQPRPASRTGTMTPPMQYHPQPQQQAGLRNISGGSAQGPYQTYHGNDSETDMARLLGRPGTPGMATPGYHTPPVRTQSPAVMGHPGMERAYSPAPSYERVGTPDYQRPQQPYMGNLGPSTSYEDFRKGTK